MHGARRKGALRLSQQRPGLAVRALLFVRPAWALSCRWKSGREAVIPIEANRNCGRATDRGKEAGSETAGRYTRTGSEAAAGTDFSKHSHGFRPGHRAHDAVVEAQRHVQAGRKWVVDVDLEHSRTAGSGSLRARSCTGGGQRPALVEELRDGYPHRFPHPLLRRAGRPPARRVTSTPRTARCGRACRVVWQGSRGITSGPYADVGRSRGARARGYATCVLCSSAVAGASISRCGRLSLRDTAFSFTLTLTIRDTPGSPMVTP